MSARKIWCPSESIVAELPPAQPTASEAIDRKNDVEANSNSGAGATLAKTKPKIIRRRTPTVDVNSTCNCTSSNDNENFDTDQCGRGTSPTATYSTIENTGPRANTKTLVSNLMQRDKPVPSKGTDFHGWLYTDPVLHWRNIFIPKLEHASNRNAKNSHHTRRHRSEEFVFQHYKDISEYMNYYRKHCSLTSLSVPSLKQQSQQKTKDKFKQDKGRKSKQDRGLTRPSTTAVFRTIDDSGADQKQQLMDKNRQANRIDHQQQIPKLAELENRLNLTASILVRRPTPPSIVNKESTSIILCGSNSSEKYHKDDCSSQNKETVVKSTSSTAEGVELPPINSCYHSSIDSSISVANYLHINSRHHKHALLADFVGAEGELEDHHIHNVLDNHSDLALVSSVSVIQQPNSATKLESQHDVDESHTDNSRPYPYLHFQIQTSSHYDRITREQLLSSKAHALGLLSSKNWTKSKKDGKTVNSDAPLARIRSSTANRSPRGSHDTCSFAVPTLKGVDESTSKKTQDHFSHMHDIDTIHNRLKTAHAGVTFNSTTPSPSRPIHTSQGSKSQHHRATSNTRHTQQQARKQCIMLASQATHPKRQSSGLYRNQQLKSGVDQVNERFQGILKGNSTIVSHNSLVAS